MQVLVWSAAQVDDFRAGDPGNTFFTLFDPKTDAVGELQSVNIGHDMFCPGVVMLRNGAYMIVGGSSGNDGARESSKFSAGAFIEGPRIVRARAYNSAVTLAEGQV